MSLFQGWRRSIPFGRRSEISGAAYLRSLGFRIVASQFKTRDGEIDLIAWEGDTLVFVEVKALHSTAPPEDAVGLPKQQRVQRAARAYVSRYRLRGASSRFDILAVNSVPGRDPEYKLIRDAFGRQSWE